MMSSRQQNNMLANYGRKKIEEHLSDEVTDHFLGYHSLSLKPSASSLFSLLRGVERGGGGGGGKKRDRGVGEGVDELGRSKMRKSK